MENSKEQGYRKNIDLKKPLVISFLLIIASLTSACSIFQQAYYDTAQVAKFTGIIDRHAIRRSGRWVLAPESSFYIAVNPAINQASTQFSDQISMLLETAARSQFSQVKRADASETYGYAATNAAKRGYRYLVYPEILVWDDTIGGWMELLQVLKTEDSQGIIDSFGRDRVRLQIKLSESNNRRLVDLAFVDAESGLFTVYGNSPQQLLQAAVSDYFESLSSY